MKFSVLKNLRMDGEKFSPGDQLETTREKASDLLEMGVLEELETSDTQEERSSDSEDRNISEVPSYRGSSVEDFKEFLDKNNFEYPEDSSRTDLWNIIKENFKNE